MGVPPDPPVDLGFLADPVETEEQRQAFLASAIHYARRACALADKLLDPQEGQDGLSGHSGMACRAA